MSTPQEATFTLTITRAELLQIQHALGIAAVNARNWQNDDDAADLESLRRRIYAETNAQSKARA